MSTDSSPPDSEPTPDATPERLKLYLTLWRDEQQAGRLYRALADMADERRRPLFFELAEVEDKHAAHWERLLLANGVTPTLGRTPLKARALRLTARRFGVDRVLPAIIKAEASDSGRYRDIPEALPEMADEEAGHGRALAAAAGNAAGPGLAVWEGRHRTNASGPLRPAVFGINDGLVSNLALIMGVAGGTADASTVVLAGVAGLVAGAASMGAGEWISVRAQRELLEREIEVEREELREFPDDEQRELELIYQAKGLPEADAKAVAEHLMADPDTALDAMAREELGLDPDDLGSPWMAAISSFFAFSLGATVPLLPFLFSRDDNTLVVSAGLSMLTLAAVGAGLSFLSGRSWWFSALRMMLVGGGAAAVTYGIGTAVGVSLT